MCGIVGYVGPDRALPIVLEGLRRLEYRGYDSAGVAVLSDGLSVVKRAGKLASLESALEDEDELVGNVAMGHTRWATHGAPDGSQRPPASGLPRPDRRDPQRHHRELPDAPCPLGEGRTCARVGDRHRVHRAPDRGARPRRGGVGRRRARHRPRAAGRVRARRGVRGRPRSHRRGQGLVTARGRDRRRRDPAGLGHPRAARAGPRP